METSTLSLVSSQTSGPATVVSSHLETELRTTVLANIDLTITTLSPLSSRPDDGDDDVTPSQRATVRTEVTTTATEIPNQIPENPVMDQTGTLPDFPAANNPDSPDKIEEDGSQQNIPLLNVDVNDLVPALQNEGLDQIKRQFYKNISTKYFQLFLQLNFLFDQHCRCSSSSTTLV